MTSQALTREQIMTPYNECPEVECCCHETGKPAGALVPLPLRTQVFVLEKEWNHRRKHHRKQWCLLNEFEVEGGDDAFCRQLAS
ncbi:MAG: hypothetical protein P8Z78_09650 [Gammaproteobacteria bacterium]